MIARSAARRLARWAQGVRFEREPFDLPGGTYAALRDQWDNLFVLAENKNG